MYRCHDCSRIFEEPAVEAQYGPPPINSQPCRHTGKCRCFDPTFEEYPVCYFCGSDRISQLPEDFSPVAVLSP